MVARYDTPSPDIEQEDEPMNAQAVAASLTELVSELTYLDAEDVAATFSADVSALMGARVSSYEEAGVLTRDAGFVLRLADRSEYQVTIVRSR